MLKPRLIPVLLLKNGVLVRSRTFNFHQSIGDPLHQVERLTAWKADELIYLDISRDDVYDYRETMQVISSTSASRDLEVTTAHSFVEIIKEISKSCFIPLTVGGKIHTIDDVRLLLKSGADKVSINTQALEQPTLIEEVAKTFGSQCVVASVDVKYDSKEAAWQVYSKFGTTPTHKDPISWCRELEERGAGEILLQSIDRDGTGVGYDIPLIKGVAQAVSIPVIALGGVGTFDHLVEGLTLGKASAVAAANIFHFTEQSIIHAKRHMQKRGIDVRL